MISRDAAPRLRGGPGEASKLTALELSHRAKGHCLRMKAGLLEVKNASTAEGANASTLVAKANNAKSVGAPVRASSYNTIMLIVRASRLHPSNVLREDRRDSNHVQRRSRRCAQFVCSRDLRSAPLRGTPPMALWHHAPAWLRTTPLMAGLHEEPPVPSSLQLAEVLHANFFLWQVWYRSVRTRAQTTAPASNFRCNKPHSRQWYHKISCTFSWE